MAEIDTGNTIEYDVTSYSIVLPVSISALVFRLWSICFWLVQFCTLNVHISICFCLGFRHAHLCTNYYPYYSCMGFRHALLCTNDCHILMGFRHAQFCTNDYPFLCVWVFVMHIFVRMTIHIHMGFRHGHFCTNDYSYSFLMVFRQCTFLYE